MSLFFTQLYQNPKANISNFFYIIDFIPSHNLSTLIRKKHGFKLVRNITIYLSDFKSYEFNINISVFFISFTYHPQLSWYAEMVSGVSPFILATPEFDTVLVFFSLIFYPHMMTYPHMGVYQFISVTLKTIGSTLI